MARKQVPTTDIRDDVLARARACGAGGRFHRDDSALKVVAVTDAIVIFPPALTPTT